MPQLMITCPVHHRDLPTNRSIRAEDFAAIDLGTNTVGPCPHCGAQHTWTKAQAHLAVDRPRRMTPDQRH
jgi:hypothetical protein